MPVTICTKDLVKKYGQRVVVNHVSFEVKQGEIVGLLGPNGAGKTTSFYQVVGLIKPDEGRVFLNEEDITSLPMYKRAKMGIGYLPQEASVFRKLSVEDNISAILEMTKLSKKEQREKLESLISEFRLDKVRKSNGDVLSGGERRRTEIARALATDPKFILLDEPFAGIDPIAVEDIQAIVAKLKYKNIGILITDHNVTETLSICDRAYLLIEGKIFQHGTAEELAANEEVKRLYLGRNFELKRKDYLHEEARGEASLPKETDNNETKSNAFANYAEHTFNRSKEILKYVEGIYLFYSSGGYTFDVRLDEYCLQLSEFKKACIREAEAKKRNEISTEANRLIIPEYKEYKKAFEAENWIKNMHILGLIFGWLFRIPFFMKIRKLKKILQHNEPAIGNLAFLTKSS